MKKNSLDSKKITKRNHVSHKKGSQAEDIRAIRKAHARIVGDVPYKR